MLNLTLKVGKVRLYFRNDSLHAYKQIRQDSGTMNDFIESIKLALSNIEKCYCLLAEGRYQERSICYEFYHQFRNLIDNEHIDLGGRVVQAEVDKRYQHYENLERIPDFIFHIPDTQDNLAVLEFKMATDLEGISEDLKKLLVFGQNLNYRYLVQVIIGDSESLNRARNHLSRLENQNGREIVVISLDTRSWKVRESKIFCSPRTLSHGAH